MSNTNRRHLKRLVPRARTVRPEFHLVGHGLSDVGRRREANEDSYLMLPRNHLWIVADGMGGHAGGQTASTLTVQTAAQAIVRRVADAEKAAGQNGQGVDLIEVLDGGIRDACAKVYDTARDKIELTNMGSTVTLMMAYGEHAWFGHVGDSRAYLIRDGAIHQITEDHSLVQEQVAQGIITPEQAKVSMMRNIITRSIGYERDVKVDVGTVPLRKGDVYLLCSDGLTGHVEDHELLDLVLTHGPASAGAHLVHLANSRGGDDNSTVVLVEVRGRRGKQRLKHRHRA